MKAILLRVKGAGKEMEGFACVYVCWDKEPFYVHKMSSLGSGLRWRNPVVLDKGPATEEEWKVSFPVFAMQHIAQIRKWQGKAGEAGWQTGEQSKRRREMPGFKELLYTGSKEYKPANRLLRKICSQVWVQIILNSEELVCTTLRWIIIGYNHQTACLIYFVTFTFG